MTITWGGSGALIAAASGTAAIISLPAGITAGNVLVIGFASKNNATHVYPSTWQKIAQENASTHWTASLAWKVATGSDSNPTVTWAGSAASLGVMAFIDSADTFNPIGVNSVNGTGSGTTHSKGAVTTSRQNSLAVYFDFAGGANGTSGLQSGWTDEIAIGSSTANAAITVEAKAVAAQNSSSGAISVTGASGVWITGMIEFLSAMPPQAGDTFASWKDVPQHTARDPGFRADPNIQNSLGLLTPITLRAATIAPRYLPDNAYRTDPDAQTNLDALTVYSQKNSAIRATTIAPRYLADPGYRTDPNAQFLLNTALSPPSAPPISFDRPLPLRPDNGYRTDPLAQSNTEYLSASLILVPFTQLDARPIPGPEDRRAIDPDAQRNLLSLLNPSLIAVPFTQYDQLPPKGIDDGRRVDPDLQSNLDALTVYSQSNSAIRGISIAPRYLPDNGQRIDPNAQFLLNTLLAVSAPPFSLKDWPTPQQVQQFIRTFISANPNYMPPVPFRQTDWPILRSADDKRRVDSNWQTSLEYLSASLILVPFTQWDQRPPQGPLDILRTWVQGPPPPSANPFRQTDWPLTSRTPYRDYGWFTALNPAAVIYPQFINYDWPNPRGIDDHRRVDPNIQLLSETLLATVIQYPPFINRDWPLTPPPKDILRTWFQGPIPSTIPVFPVAQLRDFPNPIPPRDILRTWFQGPVPSTLFAPVAQRDWQLPIQPRDILRTWAWSFNPPLEERPPIAQHDWPNPTQPSRIQQTWAHTKSSLFYAAPPFLNKDFQAPLAREYAAFLRTFSSSIPNIVMPPNAQRDWPNPILPARPAILHTFVNPIATTGETVAPPFINRDWPLPGRFPWFSGYWARWALEEPDLFKAPPFINRDWPVPLGSKLPYPTFLRTYGYWRVPTPLASLKALKFALARRELIALARNREAVALAAYRNNIALAIQRQLTVLVQKPSRFVVYSPRVEMSQAHDLEPAIDVGEEETVGFDFGPVVNSNYNTLTGTNSGVSILTATVSAQVSQASLVPDPNPGAMVLSDPIIVASNENGAPNAQVNVLLGGPQLQAGAKYVVICTVTTSDGQTFTDWARWQCSAPS